MHNLTGILSQKNAVILLNEYTSLLGDLDSIGDIDKERLSEESIKALLESGHLEYRHNTICISGDRRRISEIIFVSEAKPHI